MQEKVRRSYKHHPIKYPLLNKAYTSSKRDKQQRPTINRTPKTNKMQREGEIKDPQVSRK